MKPSLKLLVAASLAGAFFYVSCKKEYSCEDCFEKNKPPIAIAGPDLVITLPTDSASLDGRSSSDPDGSITDYKWTKISGPASFTINNVASALTSAKNLTVGSYLFELTIIDNGGLSATDTMRVIVDAMTTTNHPPIANAGTDQTITLPTNSVIVNGSGSTDPDNNITTYEWTKVSGPPSFSINSGSAVQTQVINLVEGFYKFELKVIDADGLFSKDTMQVVVVNLASACTDCRIVFVSDRDGNSEIYSCKVDGSDIRRLTSDAGTDEDPAWSPDRSRIAFISDRTVIPELYIMNAEGSNVIRKTFSGTYSQNPTWSPDGTKIAYSTVTNGSSNIWVVNAISGSQILLFEAPGLEEQPAWSPDGTKIALVSDWMAYDFVIDIYTINADGTGFTPLTGNIFDNLDYLCPSWSPGSTRLAMSIRQKTGIDQYFTQIGVMNSNGSGITVVRSDAAKRTRTSWSGDGNKIAYTSLFGLRKDVSWVSADGSAWGTIVTNGWNADWQH
ncbi:MAG TPA: hypothetical protein VFN95_03980 [Flavitalea sp.]|nr:hypothetical protein [Flavitalea sp.]